MTGLMQRLRGLMNRGQLDQDLRDELAGHLALKQMRLEREGLSPEEAERQARLELGNPAVWQETTRELWMWPWLEGVWRDVTYGVRVLSKDRAFTAVALLTLALGIGANTAVFSLLNGILWRALPVHEPDELVRIRVTNLPKTDRMWVNGRTSAATERRQIPYPLFELLSNENRLFQGVFGVVNRGYAPAEIAGTPYQLNLSSVSGTYFDVLGVNPAAGRLLTPEDDKPGGPSSGWSVVISDQLWSRVYHRRPDAIGSQLTLERIPFTIVGVAPAQFPGISPGTAIEVWAPLRSLETMYPRWQWHTDKGLWMVMAMARLRSGVTIEEARRQLKAQSPALLEQVKTPDLRGEGERQFLAMQIEPVPGRSGFTWLMTTFGPALWTMMAAVGAVLLIAATNLTNLLLARSTARREEIAVRLALGASAGRIRRQLLIESMLLALGGSVLGLLVARWLVAAMLRGISSPDNPIQLQTPLDTNVLGFLAATLSGVVLIAGWAPAWSALRGAIYTGVKQKVSSRPVTILRSGLIVLQMAFSLALLGGAGLLLVSLRSLLNEGTGMETARTVFFSPDLYNAGISREGMPRAYDSILERVRTEPGVRAAAWTQFIPLGGGFEAYTIEVPGKNSIPPADRMAFMHRVTEDYFSAAGVRLLAGRDFPKQAATGAKPVVISENLARRFFGSPAGAIGQRLKMDSEDWKEVIGVVADAKYQHVREPSPLTVYTSIRDNKTANGMTLVVNHDGPRQPLVSAVLGLLRKEAPRMPYTRVRTLDENISQSTATERTLTLLLGGFALFALLISATGIAGLLSYTVQLRRREIGVRIALGATPSKIEGQFRLYGVRLAFAGLAAGAIFSFWLRRALDGFLFHVQPGNLSVWIAVCDVLLISATAASAIPARRAAKMDPMTVLRAD